MNKIASGKGRGMVGKLLSGMLAYKLTVGGGRKQASTNEHISVSSAYKYTVQRTYRIFTDFTLSSFFFKFSLKNKNPPSLT